MVDKMERQFNSVKDALYTVWQNGYDEACHDMSAKNGWHNADEKPDNGKKIIVASLDPERNGWDYYVIDVDTNGYASLMPCGNDKWMYIFEPKL